MAVNIEISEMVDSCMQEVAKRSGCKVSGPLERGLREDLFGVLESWLEKFQIERDNYQRQAERDKGGDRKWTVETNTDRWIELRRNSCTVKKVYSVKNMNGEPTGRYGIIVGADSGKPGGGLNDSYSYIDYSEFSVGQKVWHIEYINAGNHVHVIVPCGKNPQDYLRAVLLAEQRENDEITNRLAQIEAKKHKKGA